MDAATTTAIADRIESVFPALSAASTMHGMVSLLDVRNALPEVTREDFDAGLHEVRCRRVLRLEAFEGRHYQPRVGEVEAGIEEMGRRLIWLCPSR